MIRRPRPRASLLLPLLLALVLAACASSGADSLARYEETCADCGMQWSVTILENDAGAPARAKVTVRNTGERGALNLVFSQVGGAYLDTAQAASWASVYANARATRTVPQQFARLGSTNTVWRAARDTRVPVSLAVGSSWSGEFEVEQGNLPADAAGLILTFGPVQYEKTASGQPASESWITWDRTRPFIGLRGEVAVTPLP